MDTTPGVNKNRARVREMFNAVAPSYDRLNRLLSLGVDRIWRRRAVRSLSGAPGDRVLDLCAGTGDMALEWLKNHNGEVFVCDFSHPMLQLATDKIGSEAAFAQADALMLPFPDAVFDGVLCAFGLRNLEDLPTGLQSIYRVLKPGGAFSILEFVRDPERRCHNLLQTAVLEIIPLAAKLLSPEPDAYIYLKESVREFCTVRELEELVTATGFQEVRSRQRSFGLCAHFTGRKPSQ